MYHGAVIDTGVVVNFEMLFKKYSMNVKKKSLKDLRGKIDFREDYNYKLMREKA